MNSSSAFQYKDKFHKKPISLKYPLFTPFKEGNILIELFRSTKYLKDLVEIEDRRDITCLYSGRRCLQLISPYCIHSSSSIPLCKYPDEAWKVSWRRHQTTHLNFTWDIEQIAS